MSQALCSGWGRFLSDYGVLVLDDHELFSTAVELTLRSRGLDARRPATLTKECIAETAAAMPIGLVVLDLNLGHDAQQRRVNSVELVSALRGTGWQVLVVSGSVDPPRVAVAIAEGAIGFIPKSASFQVLLETVSNAAAGRPVMSESERHAWLDLHRTTEADEQQLAQRLGRLSRREREVLERLVEGHRATAIAGQFVVSLTTVRTQIRSILTKLEVGSQVEAIALVRGHLLE